MNDLYQKVICDGAPHPEGWLHAREWDMVPVEPVGTIIVDRNQWIGPQATDLPPGEYDIVPREADDE